MLRKHKNSSVGDRSSEKEGGGSTQRACDAPCGLSL